MKRKPTDLKRDSSPMDSNPPINPSIDKVARWIVDKDLAVPATFFIEMHRPLNNIFANGAYSTIPLLTPFYGLDRMRNFQQIFENKNSMDELLLRIKHHSEARKSLKQSKIASQIKI